MINYRSVDDLSQLIKSKLSQIPDVDCIAGVPRSGMLPASLIALYLGKPLISVENIGHGDYNTLTSRVKLMSKSQKVLVVDDSCSSGHAMKQVKDMLSTIQNREFIYCAIYVLESSKQYVDFWFEVCPHLRLFEWNIMDHGILKSSCVDMDGVLCEDPTIEQNDDGEKYLEFLRTAKPKFIPQHQIDSIVTCRLEKYRKETEEWLQQHGVKYSELYMMDYPTAELRRKAGNYSQYKANIFIETGAELFIESSIYFAEAIYSFANKPVYCIANNKFYGG